MHESLRDRSADEIAVFGPASVVVFDIMNAQQVFEDEPGMAGVLAMKSPMSMHPLAEWGG